MAQTPTRNIMFKFLGDKKSLEKATRSTTKSLGKVEKSAGGANKSLGILKSGAAKLGALLAVGVLFKGMKSAVLRAQEMDSQYAITEKVIERTGGAANLTGEQVKAMSKEMAMTTGIDKVVATEAANILLTFKALRNEVGEGNDVFARAHALTADLATVMGGSATAQAITLGKALNAPVEGLTALRRVGVTFTEDQKKVIKSMVKTGDVLGAQKIMLDELESQLGGTAVASADATAIIGNAWQEVLELIGEQLLPMLAEIAPAIVAAVENIEPAFRFLGDMADTVQAIFDTMTAGFTDTGDASMLAGDRVGGFKDDMEKLGSFLSPISGGVDAMNEAIRGTATATSDAAPRIADMAGGLGDLEWQTERTTGEVADLVDETANLANEMRKLVDPVFKVRKAQEKYDKVLKEVTADQVLTTEEADRLAQAHLDLQAATEAVTPEAMEAYEQVISDVRASVIADFGLIQESMANLGSETALQRAEAFLDRVEALSAKPITIDFIGFQLASRADIEQTVTRTILGLQRRGVLGNVFLQ